MSEDEIVDEVRRVREELIARHGGLDGWIEHLQNMDQQRIAKAKQNTKKKAASRTSRAPTARLKKR